MKTWPDAEKDEAVTLPGGTSASTDLDLAANQDFWVEVSYATGGQAKGTVTAKYEHRKPFGFRVTKLVNPGKANLIGSVPPIKLKRR
ncbi:MAG: hypothetical protein HY718_21350 [Planctomycetes bacterium]|nr:hypothetical protein [Planctomycetota bacterium]